MIMFMFAKRVTADDAHLCWEVQLLIETRVRLVTGLKRYLHKKHGEGLLSAASVQVPHRLLWGTSTCVPCYCPVASEWASQDQIAA